MNQALLCNSNTPQQLLSNNMYVAQFCWYDFTNLQQTERVHGNLQMDSTLFSKLATKDTANNANLIILVTFYLGDTSKKFFKNIVIMMLWGNNEPWRIFLGNYTGN